MTDDTAHLFGPNLKSADGSTQKCKRCGLVWDPRWPDVPECYDETASQGHEMTAERMVWVKVSTLARIIEAIRKDEERGEYDIGSYPVDEADLAELEHLIALPQKLVEVVSEGPEPSNG